MNIIMKIKCYFIPISFFVLVSCNLRDPNYSDDEINSIKLNIIKKKDTISYNDYMVYMGHNGLDDLLDCEIMPYALKMKDSYPYAYYDVFVCFLKLNNDGKFNEDDILKLSKPEQDLLIYYLQEGAKKEDFNCLTTLASFYEEGIYYEKNLKKADSLTNINIYPREVSRP